MIHSTLLMAGVLTGLVNVLAIATAGSAGCGVHWPAASLLVTFPVGLLCLHKLTRRMASAKWR